MSQARTGHKPEESEGRPEPPEVLQSRNITARVLKQKVWQPPNWGNDWVCMVIVGREGSGKSHTMLSMLEKADPSFGGDRVFFEPEGLLEYMSSVPADERRGKAVMLDEAGVGMGVRSWYSEEQIDLNKTLQTARDDNMIVGLTLPRLSELDSQMRGRLHAFLEMTKLEPGEWAEFKWKNLSPTRDENDKLYKKYPRMRVRGRVQKVTRLRIGPPSEDIVEEYEAAKQAFKADLYESTLETLSDEEEDEEDDARQAYEAIKDEAGESGLVPERYISEHGGNGKLYIDGDMLQMEYDLSVREARRAKKLLEKDEAVSIPS